MPDFEGSQPTWKGVPLVAAPNGTFVPTSMLPIGPAPSGDTSGTTDQTNIVNACNAAPAGSTLRMNGVYYVVNLVVPNQVTLDFGGWSWKRDALTTFGSAGWTTSSNYSGGILHVLGTSGAGVQIVSSLTTTGGLRNVLIIGPGSGTSIGLDIGSPAQAIVNSKFENIAIGNFATGLQTCNINECTLSVNILGCITGYTCGPVTNNNLFSLLAIQRCVAGMVSDNATVSNVFAAALFQANTGVSCDLGGINHTMISPYFENASGTAALINRNGSTIINPRFSGVNDTLSLPSVNPGFIIDPLGMAFPTTHLSGGCANVAITQALANDAIYERVYGAADITKIRVDVTASFGLIDVGVYSFLASHGASDRQPGTKKKSSGSIACPAAGVADVALGATVNVVDGDFFALAATLTTAGFLTGSNATLTLSMTLMGGKSLRQPTAFPLPATASAIPCSGQDWIMVGIQ